LFNANGTNHKQWRQYSCFTTNNKQFFSPQANGDESNGIQGSFEISRILESVTVRFEYNNDESTLTQVGNGLDGILFSTSTPSQRYQMELSIGL
jgi:hypothetical protein